MTHSHSVPRATRTAAPARACTIVLYMKHLTPFLVVLCVAGCSSVPSATSRMGAVRQNAVDDVPVDLQRVERKRTNMAWSAEITLQCARFVKDLAQRSWVAPSEKQEIIARAAILVQHAQTHMKAVAAYVPNDSKESRNAMLLLVDQSAGLESERITLEREWAVWQVQYNGLKPEETDLIFSRTPGNDPDC